MNNVKQEHSPPRYKCDQLCDILVNELPSQDFLIDQFVPRCKDVKQEFQTLPIKNSEYRVFFTFQIMTVDENFMKVKFYIKPREMRIDGEPKVGNILLK